MTKNQRRADRGPRGDRPGGQCDRDVEVRSASAAAADATHRRLEVRVEFALVDGDAGKALARRQAAVMREVLRWIHDYPANVHHDGSGTDQTRDTNGLLNMRHVVAVRDSCAAGGTQNIPPVR